MFLNSECKCECITLPQILEKKSPTVKDFALKIISVNATNDSKKMETGKVKLDLCRVNCPIDCTSVNSVSRHAHVQCAS